jgi:hypothetical protein
VPWKREILFYSPIEQGCFIGFGMLKMIGAHFFAQTSGTIAGKTLTYASGRIVFELSPITEIMNMLKLMDYYANHIILGLDTVYTKCDVTTNHSLLSVLCFQAKRLYPSSIYNPLA